MKGDISNIGCGHERDFAVSGSRDDDILISDGDGMLHLTEILHEPRRSQDGVFDPLLLLGQILEILGHPSHHGSVARVEQTCGEENEAADGVGDGEVDEGFHERERVRDGWRDEEDGGDGAWEVRGEDGGVGGGVEPVEFDSLGLGEGRCGSGARGDEDGVTVCGEEGCYACCDLSCSSGEEDCALGGRHDVLVLVAVVR